MRLLAGAAPMPRTVGGGRGGQRVEGARGCAREERAGSQTHGPAANAPSLTSHV